jgi:hypothetical protein
MMKNRYLFPLINIAAVIGCALALFTVPPETSAKVYGSVCLGAIIVINVFMISKVRASQKVGYVAKPPDKFAAVVGWVLLLVFLAQVVRGYLKYWRMP